MKVVKSESTEIATQQFSTDEIDLIKSQIAKGATDLELKYFLELCRQSGLNPFTRQIYLIERRSWDAKTQSWQTTRAPQTSIDGFRAIADSTDEYQGQVGPHWCGPDGEWHDVWVKDEFPIAARVGVLRKGFSEPLYAVAKFKEYCQRTKEGQPTKMWATMPDLMVAKCAESLALRKAFPQKLGGLYTSDEMAQAEELPETRPQAIPVESITIRNSGTGYAGPAEQQPTPPPTKAAAALIAGIKQSENPAPEPEKPADAGEPRDIPLGDTPDWIWFGKTIIDIATHTDWPDWEEKNRGNLERMQQEAPVVYDRMIKAIQKAQEPKPKRGRPPKAKTPPTLKEDPEQYLKWLETACNEASDFHAFVSSQMDIIAQGFPTDQEAARAIIKRHEPRTMP